MSTKRRVGVSSATTEAARRQLMQPVPCWEKVWVVPETAPPNSTLRVFKWIKTSKIQHFSDDEGAADEPLAPLPDGDEVEVVDDNDEDQDDSAPAAPAPDTIEAPAPENENDEELMSKPASPKPQLSMGLQPSEELGDDAALDESLKAMESNMNEGVGVGLDDGDGGLMDISSLAPDGLALEGSHDLSQMDASDALLGGPLQMDESEDPFAPPS
ncbi:hypothetical protein MSAN_02240900 [Mycena sanguinolenta]|uniref:Uncharacterized protein n=1 Tax=Mycena sanguinolenta TaxID=230812 RepID=A0A8H7CHB6_9AGAR|nr:hypothetical protein MSAN_02240900 [Mycena sanguinolenta]